VGNVAAAAKLVAVAVEEQRDVPAVAEEVHDVCVLCRMLEAERVPDLVQAGQVHDRLAQQIVQPRRLRDVGTQRVGVRTYEHHGAALTVDEDRPHLAVLAGARGNEVDAQQGRFFGSWFKGQRALRRTLPGFEGPLCELPIGGPKGRSRYAFGNEVRDGPARIERPQPCLLSDAL